MTYKTKGVCASHIEFEVDDNKKVHNVRFIGGCSGNTQGVASLVEIGMGERTVESIDEVFTKKERALAGVTAPAKGLTLVRVLYD